MRSKWVCDDDLTNKQFVLKCEMKFYTVWHDVLIRWQILVHFILCPRSRHVTRWPGHLMWIRLFYEKQKKCKNCYRQFCEKAWLYFMWMIKKKYQNMKSCFHPFKNPKVEAPKLTSLTPLTRNTRVSYSGTLRSNVCQRI